MLVVISQEALEGVRRHVKIYSTLGGCQRSMCLSMFVDCPYSCADQLLISLVHFRCLQWPLLTLRGPVSANPITEVPIGTTHKPHLPTADCLLPNAVTVTAYRWR